MNRFFSFDKSEGFEAWLIIFWSCVLSFALWLDPFFGRWYIELFLLALGFLSVILNFRFREKFNSILLLGLFLIIADIFKVYSGPYPDIWMSWSVIVPVVWSSLLLIDVERFKGPLVHSFLMILLVLLACAGAAQKIDFLMETSRFFNIVGTVDGVRARGFSYSTLHYSAILFYLGIISLCFSFRRDSRFSKTGVFVAVITLCGLSSAGSRAFILAYLFFLMVVCLSHLSLILADVNSKLRTKGLQKTLVLMVIFVGTPTIFFINSGRNYSLADKSRMEALIRVFEDFSLTGRPFGFSAPVFERFSHFGYGYESYLLNGFTAIGFLGFFMVVIGVYIWSRYVKFNFNILSLGVCGSVGMTLILSQVYENVNVLLWSIFMFRIALSTLEDRQHSSRGI